MKRKPARKATGKNCPDYGRGRRQGRPRSETGAGNSPAERPSERGQRLQKILAAAGLGSRRHCEELILAGRVEVDRQVVMELGTRVDPRNQRIRVDGVELRKPQTVWYALNKPTGVVCTSRDPGGRPRAVDLAPDTRERLFTVGRLDMNSEGLLLLTNDGDLANKLTHPRYGVSKTYRVLVAGSPSRETLVQLKRGVYLAEGVTRIAGVTVKRRYKQSTVLEMELQEGRNREIRRALARVGHKVMRLVRIATGPIRLGDLAPGGCRRLTGEEVRALARCAAGGRR